MSSRAVALAQLIERIREEGPYVLASPEDAEFFRKAIKNTPAKKKEERVVEVPELPKPPPPEPLRARQEPAPAPVAPPPPPPKPIQREEIPKPAADFASVRQVLSKVAPELLILEEIPSDLLAKKIAERWKTKNQTAPLSILCFQEPPEQKALLEELAKALDVCFGPAKLVPAESIEKERQWGAFLSVAELKMVIVCDYTLWQLNDLMHFYKETPAQGVRMLGNVPVLLLPDLSLYLKDPLLKRSLWKALCQKCS